ncbi:ribosome maturation factor RimM [Chitinophaga cymbidii]|uniref:Ribosome maturation factor RimM n=1 Tax=Chitinophaga cymbidii TaxID=1096750 RepID=A0A512RJ77_9BACT|nr:ribosome maturation factor RimM [Chitinophaga cymbidii]GEP95766.1 ribosome maturation factor RimM [Chitinophaga cymbidii]
MANYFNIGKLSAVYGTEGEMIVKHSLGKKSSLKDITAVFIEDRKDSFLPYFIQKARAKDAEHLYIKLEGIDSREAARKLLQKGIYLDEADFKGLASASAPLSLLGFSVTDKQHGPLGEISEIIEMPLQVLAKVMFREKEMLLPLNEQTLLKIDKKQQTVHLDLPEGLLDIYLG